MSTVSMVMIISIILIILVIAITLWITNRAYDILPKLSKVDPLPDEQANEYNEGKK